MTEPAVLPASRDVPDAVLGPYLLVTFGIAWAVLGLYIFLPEPMSRLFGAISGSHPLFVLAVWAPAIAAFALVLWTGGAQGLRRYLSRLTLWHCPWGWALFLLLGIPFIFALGAAVKGTLLPLALPAASPGGLLGLMAFMLVLGPVEEFGWRGVMLPVLQRRMAPVWASLAVGVVWAIWHLPAFFLAGTQQSGWSLAPFLLGTVSLSVIVTPLFNASRGSLLLAALFHYQCINPLWPDAQPYDTIFFVAAALVIVWLNRDTMFRREGAATAVIPS